MSNKRALLIGINKYPFLADFAQQKGCVNDVLALEAVLKQKFDFPAENIRTVFDEEATREGIFENMERLVEVSRETDAVVFHFSGHGSRLRTRRENKPSGWYETIMPFDSGRKKYHPEAVNRDITDDEIYDWLMCLAEKTKNITLIFDSCYSGSILRASDLASEARTVEADEETNHEASVSPFPRARQTKLRSGASGWLPVSDKYVLLAACAEYQLAYLYKDEQADKTVHYGAFSYFLCQALRETKPRATFRDLWERVYYEMSKLYRLQHPQLEGRLDRELFKIRDLAPQRFLSVDRREENQIILAGGAVHGIKKNSPWAIYPPGTKRVGENDAAIGKIKVVSVKAINSKAIIIEETRAGEVQSGMRAIEITELRKSAAQSETSENSEKIARFRRILELRNSRGRLAGKIDFDIFRFDENGVESNAESTGNEPKIVFREGERIAIRIVNRFESTVYFSILDFGLSLRIKVVYPPRGAKVSIGPLGKQSESYPGQNEGSGVFRFGFKECEQIRLGFPPGFPFSGGEAAKTEHSGIFKLVVTTRPHDLSFLEQDGICSSAELKSEIKTAAILRGDSLPGSDTLSKWENEWLTIDREFFLRKT